ncbi:MAG: hypothetical protein IBJ07_03160 [Rhizobiaceae bacterium]|nr:hypothetical protein [Rhizobiaceae bacterium]
MFEPRQDLAMPAEMLLVLAIILREGDRLDQFGLLSERVYDWLALGPGDRELLAAELTRYHAGVSTSASILALRALAPDQRRKVADQVLDFAAGDPLLSPHQRRLGIRVRDILAVDDPV